jgi:hypothetical protein
MKKMKITDPIARCELDKVGVDVSQLSVTIKCDDGTEETFAFRCFVPTVVDGKLQFMKDTINHLLALHEQTQGEEQDFYRWVFQMAAFYSACPDIDPRRRRSFNLKTLDYSKAFKEMAEMTHTESLPPSKRLVKFAGKTLAPTTRLIEEAIYRQPDIRIPLFWDEYVEFRERCLMDMLKLRCDFEKILRQQFENARRRIESDRCVSDKHRNRVLSRLRVEEEGEGSDFVGETLNKAERLVIQRAVQTEDKLSPHFAPLVEEAQRLQEPVTREVAEKGVEMVEADGETWTSEYENCILANFDSEAADALFDRVIKCYIDVHHMPVIESAFMTDDPLAGAEDASLVTVTCERVPGDTCGSSPVVTMRERTDENESIEWQQYTGLLFARHTRDIFYKWHMIGWIAANLVNFAECLRLVHREAERVWYGVLDYGFRQLYRRIRHLMSVPERRAFALMYLPLPVLDHRIAAWDPVLMSFFTGMGEETKAMIIMRLVFKVDEWNELRDIGKKLTELWRAYLRIYPLWVDIIQDEDREAKLEELEEKRMPLFSKCIGWNRKGDRITLGDRVARTKGKPEHVLEDLALEESRGLLNEWLKEYCTDKQAKRIVKYYRDRETVVEIAEEEGLISHQAVSESIHAGIGRIKDGLRREDKLTKCDF